MHTTQHTEPEQRKAPLAPIPEWLQMSKEEREERLRTFHGDIEHVYMREADMAFKGQRRRWLLAMVQLCRTCRTLPGGHETLVWGRIYPWHWL